MLVHEDASTFSGLSLQDLLEARDQFHIHLMNKANVVGTAVGRYLIRKSDPLPPAKLSEGPKPARTLENSEVRDYSWPCVLVFVSEWVDESHFGKGQSLSGFIPKAIFMPDGRSVPICIVLAPPVTTAPPPRAVDSNEHDVYSGGVLIHTKVQGVTRQATLGCLVSDGHAIYGLSNRHVCGAPGAEIMVTRRGKSEKIGTSSAKQLGRRRFTEVYERWPGANVYVQMDVGLVELD